MFVVYGILFDHIAYGIHEIVKEHLIKYELNSDVSEWAIPGTLDLED